MKSLPAQAKIEVRGEEVASTTCVIAATKWDRDQQIKHLQSQGIQVAMIDENQNAVARQA